MWNVFDIFTSALGNWLWYCSLKSGAGILISWEPKTLTNNLWSMETQSRQTKRCWTSAKVQHEKLIATVNQLKMWLSGTGQENYWYRNGFLTMSEEMRWHIKDRSTTLSFFSKINSQINLCCSLLLWATSRCSGDHMKRSRGVNVSLGDCLCLCVALTTCPGCDSACDPATQLGVIRQAFIVQCRGSSIMTIVGLHFKGWVHTCLDNGLGQRKHRD